MTDQPPLPPTEADDVLFSEFVAAYLDAREAGLTPPPLPRADMAARWDVVRGMLHLLDDVRNAPSDTGATGTFALGIDPHATLSYDLDTLAAAPLASRVGRYELIRELGRGGMGVVYLARDPALDRLVALKVIRGSAASEPRWLNRFHSEGRALGKLEHPNVVRVYESGEADGVPFLAMEYVAGTTLHSHLGGRPVSPREAAALVEAVARAHRQGIIHRDLKPANVLLSTESAIAETREMSRGSGSASTLRMPTAALKVGDFGLATSLGERSGATMTGELVGKPSYLAPETVAGASEPGPAVDIYGVGTVLYECLTGRPPGPPGQTARRYGFTTLSPSGRFAVFGEYQASDYARLVDTHTGLPIGPPIRQALLAHVALTPDERVMITAPDNYRVGGAGALHFHDTGTGRLRVPPVPLPTYVHGLTAGPEGKTVALGRTGGVTLLDFTTGKGIRMVQPSCGWSIAYSPDGKTMGTRYRGGWPGTGAGLRLWDAVTRAPIGEFQPHGEGNDEPQVWFVDGGKSVLAFGQLSQPVRLYDATTGKPRKTPQLPGRVAVFTLRAADTVAALGYSNCTVSQWNVAAGRAIGSSMQHDHPVIGIEYSADGRFLAVATGDHAVRHWDSDTAMPIGPPLLHTADVRAMRFADEGRTLVTATAAGETRRWPLPEAAPTDPAVLDLWVQAASGRVPSGTEVRLLGGGEWTARREELARHWPAGAAALAKLRATPAVDPRLARPSSSGGGCNSFAAAWHLERLAKARPTDWRACSTRRHGRMDRPPTPERDKSPMTSTSRFIPHRASRGRPSRSPATRNRL